MPERDSLQEREDAAIRKDFRRGNINFDFLQPEDGRVGETRADVTIERRSGSREGKRGLFDRGRPARPIGALHLTLWTFLLVASIGGLVALFFYHDLLFMLSAPVLALLGFWSLIMLVLFQARPR